MRNYLPSADVFFCTAGVAVLYAVAFGLTRSGFVCAGLAIACAIVGYLLLSDAASRMGAE